MTEDNLTNAAKSHYDNQQVDNYYRHVWGGENIHIGIYETPEQSIQAASQNAISKMIKILPTIKKGDRILDLGSGYGGAARYLVEKFGCKVECLNISELQNKRNEALTKKAGLEDKIKITQGKFEELPYDRESFDLVWSQDALLHSDDKLKVFREVKRVLNSSGRFIFSDPMQSNNCPDDVLKKILSRLDLKELGSFKKYKRIAQRADLEQVYLREMSDQLATHYTKVLQNLNDMWDKLIVKSDKEFLENEKQSLADWIDASHKGCLNWGILQFQKRNV